MFIMSVPCFGRPHLGPMLNKLLGLGVVYFSLCALAGYFDAVNVMLEVSSLSV